MILPFFKKNVRCQEFNIEKLQILEAEKKRIRQEFERKTKQVDIRRKMSVLLPYLVFFFLPEILNFCCSDC
jgi:hypothetical protein